MAIRMSPEHVTKGPYSSSGSRVTGLSPLFDPLDERFASRSSSHRRV
jgi:hypothetical protein